MLSSTSRLGLDINISGETTKVAQDINVVLAKTLRHEQDINTRLKEQKATLIQLKELRAGMAGQGGLTGDIDAQIAQTTKHIALTKAAQVENRQQISQYQQMAKNVDLMTGAWNKFEVVFRRVLSALISFVVINAAQKLFVGFFQGLIESNQMLEVLNARLEALVPNSEKIKAVYAELQRFTITTPFKIAEVVDAAVKLRAFGADIITNMRAVGDWASAVGKDLSSTAEAFGKIIQSSPRTALLLSTRGLSKASFDSYVMRYGDKALALNKLIEDTFGGTAEKISQTFEGIMSNISDLWTFISQKLGADLFKDLKGDLETVYSILNSIRTSTGGWLEMLSVIIDYATMTAGLVAVVGVFSLIGYAIGRIVMLLESATIASKAFMLSTAIGAVLTAIGFIVFGYIKYKVAVNDVEDAERQLQQTVVSDTSNRINLINQEIEALNRQKDSFITYLQDLQMTLFSAGLNMPTDILNKKISDLQTQLDIEKDIAETKKMQLMLDMGASDSLTRYNTALEVTKLGMSDFFKQLAQQAKATSKLHEIFNPTTREAIATHESSYFKALSIYLTGISSPADLKKAQDDLKELLTQATKIVPQDADTQAVARYIKMVEDFITMLKKAEPKVKKGKEVGTLFIDWTGELKSILDVQDALDGLYKKEKYVTGESDISGWNTQLKTLQERYLAIGDIIKSYGTPSGIQSIFWKKEDERDIKDVLILTKEQVKVLGEQIEVINKLNAVSTNFNEGLIKQLGEVVTANQRVNDTLAQISVDFVRTSAQGLIHEALFGTTGKDLDSQISDLKVQLIQIQQKAAGVIIIDDEQATLLAKINDLESKRANIVGTVLMDALNKTASKLEDVAINLMLEPLLRGVTDISKVQDRYKSSELEIEKISEQMSTLQSFIAETKMNAASITLDLDTQDLAVQQQIASAIAARSWSSGGGSGGFDAGAGAPTFKNPFPNGVPDPISFSNYSNLVKPTIGGSSTKNVKNIIISGPIYGFDDFTARVGQAQRQLKSNLIH